MKKKTTQVETLGGKPGKEAKRPKKTATAFEQYRQTLSAREGEALDEFFAQVNRRVSLARSYQARICADFENALLYYAQSGVPFEEALRRLNPSKMGGFYIRSPILWYALDDAAKIYPLSMRHGQMAVFRLSANLKEDVVPPLLQMALTFTIKRFPSFATTVKKGFFWHYLDTAKRRYRVKEEHALPCRPLAISRSGSQSFRVLYYKNRVSTEFFHILTDGTGGMVFLKTLLGEYLRLLGEDVPPSADEGMLCIDDPPTASETANEFTRADKADKAAGFTGGRAVQLSGSLSRVKPCQVLHMRMDARQLKGIARAREATVTAYILSRLFAAGRDATDERTGDMRIQVPVNMRKFYPSDTLRNFSMYCGISTPIAHMTDADALIADIGAQLNEKASREAMSRMMRATERLVRLMRYIPLFIKGPVAKIVYGFLGDKTFSNTFSNLGVIQLPPAMEAHIQSMDFILSTAVTNRAGCSMATCGSVATLSIAKMTADPSFEEALLSLLERDGLAVKVEGSELYES